MFRYLCATVLTLTCLIHGTACARPSYIRSRGAACRTKLTLPPLDPIIGNFVRAVRTSDLLCSSPATASAELKTFSRERLAVR
jgi:hypothetical protein